VYYDAISIDSIKSLDSDAIGALTNVPSINTPANSLLPQNFTILNSSQQILPLSPKSLNYNIEQSIPDFKSLVSGDVSDTFNNAIGNKIGGVDFNSSMESLDGALQNIQNKFSIESAQQMLSITNNNNSVESLGAINQSYKSVLDNASNLSPKGIRDLSNPETLSQKIQDTTSNAVQNARKEVINQVSTFSQDKEFNQSSQGNLQQLSSPNFSGDNKSGFEVFARLTVYWAQGSGTDKDSAAKRSSTGRQLSQGISAAVDPSIIPYLSRLEIPGVGTRFATDTGGAVKARVASSGRLPIIDIFFDKKDEALAFAKTLKDEVPVKVYPPSSKYTYVKNSSPTYGVA